VLALAGPLELDEPEARGEVPRVVGGVASLADDVGLRGESTEGTGTRNEIVDGEQRERACVW